MWEKLKTRMTLTSYYDLNNLNKGKLKYDIVFLGIKGGGVGRWGFESLTSKIYIHIPRVCLRLPYRSILRFFLQTMNFYCKNYFS